MKFQKYIQHIYVSCKSNPATQIATFAVLIGTYTVLTFFFVAKNNVENVFNSWGDKVQLSVYLDDDLNDTNKLKIQKTLNELESFEKYQYIDKSKAAEIFQARMKGVAADMFSDNDFDNPLPASYELSLKSSIGLESQLGLLEKAAQFIRKLPGVDEVSYGQGWVENFSNIVAGFKGTSMFVFILMLFGSALIVSNTISSSISQRKEEIEVAELVGATAAMIRAPYIFEGVFWGLLTSLCSVFVSYGLFVWQKYLFSKELAMFNVGESAMFLSYTQIFGIVLLGGVMGAVGSYLCVRKINTGWAAAQRVNGSSW